MSTVIKKLAAEGRLTPEQAANAEARANAFVKAAQANPRLMEEAMEKLGLGNPLGGALRNLWKGFRSPFVQEEAPKGIAGAIGSSMGHLLPPTLASTIVLGGLGLGTEAGRSLVSGTKDHIQKARGFKSMIEANPALKEYDSEAVQRAYNTLHRFNPSYASDPLVAGTFVATAVDQARMDTGTVNQLVRARRELSSASPTSAVDFFERMSPKAQLYDPVSVAQRAKEHEMRIREHGMKAQELSMKEERHAPQLEMDVLKAQELPGEQARRRAEYEMGMRKAVPDLELAQAKAEFEPTILQARAEHEPMTLESKSQAAQAQRIKSEQEAMAARQMFLSEQARMRAEEARERLFGEGELEIEGPDDPRIR